MQIIHEKYGSPGVQRFGGKGIVAVLVAVAPRDSLGAAAINSAIALLLAGSHDTVHHISPHHVAPDPETLDFKHLPILQGNILFSFLEPSKNRVCLLFRDMLYVRKCGILPKK